MMNTDKKYMMILTSVDQRRVREGTSPIFFWDNPWEGKLEEIVFGDTCEELKQNGKYIGLFHQTYETKTGRRISYGGVDNLSPWKEIEKLEENKKV